MYLRDESQRDTIRALKGLIEAFSGPHWAHPAYTERVLTYAIDLLDIAVIAGDSRRARMPTQMWPRSAVFEVPNPPPVPPAAL